MWPDREQTKEHHPVEASTLRRTGPGKKQMAGTTGWGARHLAPTAGILDRGATITISVGKGSPSSCPQGYSVFNPLATCYSSLPLLQSLGERADPGQGILEDT